ncbi:MAG: MXAN_6640 family putative metalloprotease [bacterium]
MIRRNAFLTLGLLLLSLSSAVSVLAAGPNAGLEFLAKVEAAVTTSELTAEEGLLYKFHYGFDQDALPVEYRPTEFAPLKNGTAIMAEYAGIRDKLSPRVVEAIEAYLNPTLDKADKASYISPSGYFRMNYDTSGADAPPSTDVDPANGIPDFVEKCALYMDFSQDQECNVLGFTTPSHSPYYEIYFEDMGYYGYTTSTGTYTTRITLHNDYLGFPPNDDPEGNQWGAAKVTCCHEFKHATQKAGSAWSEGGWVEVDATWSEDIIYDVVNDYYNYLTGGDPITAPATSLDSGGSGSYEDCVWQLWMSETYGNQIIVDLWDWRKTHTSQAMMDSYNQMLVNNGSSVAASWPTFTAWNYACGGRWISGFGYDEARDYPTSGTTHTISAYPTTKTGSVAKIAANFARCSLFTGAPGTVDVQFNGADGSQIALTAIIKKFGGAGVIEYITLDANNDADVSLSVPRDEIQEVGFSISNGTYTGGSASYSITVDESDVVLIPQITLDPTSFDKTMDPDSYDTELLEIGNTGEVGSSLDFSVVVQGSAPKAGGEKSIGGSTFICDASTYESGTTATLSFTVYNASGDDEWLSDVTLDFPSGITVTSSTNFVGGTYGPMTTDGSSGNGALVSWHGDTGSPNYYGVVVGGESATGTVNVSYDGGLAGPKYLAYTVTGDGWGATPHTMSGNIVLTAAGPTITVTAPDGGEVLAINDSVDITWSSTGGLIDVKIDLSRNGGGSWESISASTTNDGFFNWTVNGPAAAVCLVRVSALDDSVSDTSDAVFTIYKPVDWLTVNPDTGSVPQGSTQNVTLQFDSAGMAQGDYTAYLVITHNGPGSPSVVPVTLHVNDSLSGAGGLPYTFHFDGNYPNPFNPTTTIVFTLARPGKAAVDVFDLQGRLVRTVWQGDLQSGSHHLQWNGRDDNGRMVAAGTYFGRLHTAERTETCKMVLAK